MDQGSSINCVHTHIGTEVCAYQMVYSIGWGSANFTIKGFVAILAESQLLSSAMVVPKQPQVICSLMNVVFQKNFIYKKRQQVGCGSQLWFANLCLEELVGYPSKCSPLRSGVGSSTKMAINKWVNGTPLEDFRGDENGNGCYYQCRGTTLLLHWC